MSQPDFIQRIKFDENGLVPAIVQDATSHEVLMVAYMNEEAVQKTVETKKAHFYSRSRKKMWLKGESSGHIQSVKEIRYDCDGDALVVIAEQAGGACHAGYKSCFYRTLEKDQVIGEKIFNPDEVYGSE